MGHFYNASQAESLFHQLAQSDCIELMPMCETSPATLIVYRTAAYGAVCVLKVGTVHVDMCVEAMSLCQLSQQASRADEIRTLTDSASSGKSSKFRITTSQRTYRSLR